MRGMALTRRLVRAVQRQVLPLAYLALFQTVVALAVLVMVRAARVFGLLGWVTAGILAVVAAVAAVGSLLPMLRAKAAPDLCTDKMGVCILSLRWAACPVVLAAPGVRPRRRILVAALAAAAAQVRSPAPRVQAATVAHSAVRAVVVVLR